MQRPLKQGAYVMPTAKAVQRSSKVGRTKYSAARTGLTSEVMAPADAVETGICDWMEKVWKVLENETSLWSEIPHGRRL